MRAAPAILVVEDNAVLDLNLPRRDGRELLLDIKRDPALRAVPVIVITASDAETSYASHATCFLQKPLDVERLLGTLDAAASFWLDAALLPTRR